MLPILHPFEPTGGHASGVDQDVGHDRDPAAIKDRIGFRLDRGVGRLDDDRRPHRLGVARVEHSAERCGNKHVAVKGQEFGIRNRIAPREALQPVGMALRKSQQFEHIEAVGTVKARRGIADRHDLALRVAKEAGGVGAHVAEALDGDPCARNAAAQPAEQLQRQAPHAAAGCLIAAWNPVILHRLAGDAGRGKSVVLVILIHDPRHHLRRGAHVGRGDVDIGTEQDEDGIHEPPGNAFQYPRRQLRRIDGNAALGTAIGDVDHRGFPGHQRGQGPDLVKVDPRMVPQPALHWTASGVVLHSVADEGRHLTRVELDRDLHLHLAFGRQQEAADVVGEVELISRPVKVDANGFAGPHDARRSPRVWEPDRSPGMG